MKALALSSMALLCACVSSPPPGVDAHKYDRDRIACGQEAVKRHDFPNRKWLGSGLLGDIIARQIVPTETSDDDYTKECMRKRGYEIAPDAVL